ncbi:MAG: hypothetical protein M3417_14645 [Actinomycetota bacterium]|nr:hypothetical protein [Actinomycetota bacterium]
MGLSLYQVERLENGHANAAAFLPSVAAATAKQEGWFHEATPGALGAAPASEAPRVNGRSPHRTSQLDQASTDEHARSSTGATLVLASLVLLVVVRFFTEVVVVLPRFANFVDIPIFFTIVFFALLRAKPIERPQALTPLLLMTFGVVALCVLATLTNLSRVDLAPALVFVYGFLGPIGVFVAVHSLWPVGSAIRLSRLLIALCVLQLVIAFAVDLPLFLAGASPDVISGTFGENPYQLVYFLLVMAGLLAGVFTFEKGRLAARLTPFLLIAILAVIFLAQYRSLLATTGLTIVLLAIMLSSMGTRGVMIAAVSATALLGTMVYLAQTIPELKFQATIEDSGGDPTIYVKERLSRLDVIGRVFADTPRFALTGTGPGTYSSRAWRTFALDSDSDADVAGDYVLLLTQGRPYRTDVSDRYVAPQLRNQQYISGSTAITRPFATYLSLLAELGVFGFLLLVGAYVWALVCSARMALVSGRAALPGDPLPGLCCAGTVAFFVLLQMAALDNWLEVTRITFIAWIIFAVAMKEFAGRKQINV